MRFLLGLVFVLLVKLPAVLREPQKFFISKSELKDKIKGAWAGQVIGVAFANSISSPVNAVSVERGFLAQSFMNQPDTYDDVFLDMALLEVIEAKGLDASPQLLATAYANINYNSSHGNLIGQYNIRHGLKPPSSGHWTNNPHADDTDFQMQADFIGVMCPALPEKASTYSDRVGHIMSSGDGYYAGLYVATLYSLSFTNKRISEIVSEAVSAIPERTKFNECINQAIFLHKEFPDDWRRAKFQLLKRWSKQVRCPAMTDDHTVDARISAAFVTLALLYGEQDFAKTLEISAGLCNNSDNHTASVAGILGAILGFKKIPDLWKEDIPKIDTIELAHTKTSLSKACELSYKHAMKNIGRVDGKVKENNVFIPSQQPVLAKVERCFEGHNVAEIRSLNDSTSNSIEFDFEGIGFLVQGNVGARLEDDVVFAYTAEVYINKKLTETVTLPVSTSSQRADLFWKYQLPHGKHHVRIVLLNRSDLHRLKVTDLVVYDVTEVTLSRLPR